MHADAISVGALFPTRMFILSTTMYSPPSTAINVHSKTDAIWPEIFRLLEMASCRSTNVGVGFKYE